MTSAMFSDIEQLKIYNGKFNFTVNNYARDDNILNHVAFRSLPRSRDAAFCAAVTLDNLSRRSCTEGTRVDIIAQIVAWVTEKDPARTPPVYWLTGLAGLGKTTIAYTICELLNEASLPFASFFCSLQLDSRNSKLLVPTLCRDLAELYKPYAANVLPILESNSKVVDASLRIQIDELLARPWQASIAQQNNISPTVVVLDALDECDRGTQFLEELLRVIHLGQLPGIKFLITSRPNPEIVDICKSFPPNAVCKLHEVDTSNVQHDIEKYLREALPKLKDEPELALLSQRAGGWFIYAATAVKFISPVHSPRSIAEMRIHLRALLDSGPLTSYAKSGERLLVDELYRRILSVAFRDAGVRATRLPILHTIICAESRINVSVLANLTSTDQDTVEKVVESLHAVLFVSPKDRCVYWYHASFPDFLFTRARAGYPTQGIDILCDKSARHGVLARRCFSVMRESLHFNMCNFPSSYVLDCEVPGLNASVDRVFSPTLRYVSRHWAKHLFQAVPAKNDTDDLFRDLKDFLDKKLLFWIEAMNLINAEFECSGLLRDAECWLDKGTEWPDVLNHLADAINFSIFFAGSPASKSTPHLYISALSIWNQDSPVWATWRHRFKFIPSLLLRRVAVTIPLLAISAADRVDCVTFSPDNNQIVFGCWDGSVQVWDAKTGKQLKELRGHTDHVFSVTFSPDGNRMASGAWDHSVRVWDTKTGEQLKELRGHKDAVFSVVFSPDGNRIVSGSWDCSVLVWDANSGEQLRELRGHMEQVKSVACSPDGNIIACGSEDASVWLWDGETGKKPRELRGHTEGVDSVTFSPDGNQLVSGSYDRSVGVWDAKTGKLLRDLRGHTNAVRSVAFSRDGNRLVTGSKDMSVCVWDANSGERLRELQGHTNDVNEVAFSPDGNRIVSGSYDKSVLVWDAIRGEQLRKLQGHTNSVQSVAFSRDGNQLVSGSLDKSVRVWDAKTGEQLRELREYDEVNAVAFSPDGNRIVYGSSYRGVMVWGVKANDLKVLHGHTHGVTSVAFSSDGNRIVSGSLDSSVRMWDAKTGEQAGMRHTDGLNSVAFSPDGRRIASGSWGSSDAVQVWDAETNEQLKIHTTYVTSVSFSPDGNQLVSGSKDMSVCMWDTKTGEKLRELHGHTDQVNSVAFSPDGNRLVSGSKDKSVCVWDAKRGEQLRELQGHTGEVNEVAFSPGGSRIVSCSSDKSVRVWNANSGEQLRELLGHTNEVESVVFSRDGKHLVSGSLDKSVRVWDAKTGKQLMEWIVPAQVNSVACSSNLIVFGSWPIPWHASVGVWNPATGKVWELKGHTHEVKSVAFSPSGKQIVSGSLDKSVLVWDARTGEQLQFSVSSHTHHVRSVAFSPDGNKIVSGSWSNSDAVRVWDVKTGKQLRVQIACITSVAFSPDGNQIVSGSKDRSVLVWDAKTGELLRDLQAYPWGITSVAFSPDGNRIVCGCRENVVQMWDAKTGKWLRELRGHTRVVTSVMFSPDSKRIVSASEDKSVRVWGNLDVDAPWVIKEDGWILSGAERLAWVPSTICNVLQCPHTILLISRNGSATISFEDCKLGTSWHECYIPSV